MLAVIAFLSLSLCKSVRPFPAFSQLEIIDLTYPLNNSTIFWPGAQTFHHPEVFAGRFQNIMTLTMGRHTSGETNNGYYYSAYNFLSAEHGGTHLDAPVHFARGKETTDQVNAMCQNGLDG